MKQSTLISEDRDLKSDTGQDSIERAFFQTGKGKSLSSPRPEGSNIKINQEGSTIFIYVDDKLVQEIRINE